MLPLPKTVKPERLCLIEKLEKILDEKTDSKTSEHQFNKRSFLVHKILAQLYWNNVNQQKSHSHYRKAEDQFIRLAESYNYHVHNSQEIDDDKIQQASLELQKYQRRLLKTAQRIGHDSWYLLLSPITLDVVKTPERKSYYSYCCD